MVWWDRFSLNFAIHVLWWDPFKINFTVHMVWGDSFSITFAVRVLWWYVFTKMFTVQVLWCDEESKLRDTNILSGADQNIQELAGQEAIGDSYPYKQIQCWTGETSLLWKPGNCLALSCLFTMKPAKELFCCESDCVVRHVGWVGVEGGAAAPLLVSGVLSWLI